MEMSDGVAAGGKGQVGVRPARWVFVHGGV